MKSAYAVRRPVVNAYLVRERDRRRQRELAMVLLAILPLGMALLAYTWIHLELLHLGYQIDQLERDLHHLQQVERQLRLEASHLANPGRVEERAIRDLAMERPSLEEMIFYHELGETP